MNPKFPLEWELFNQSMCFIGEGRIGHTALDRAVFRRMSVEAWNLYAELERAPEDWSIRLRLIEAAVADGDLAEARRLVRSSPEEDGYLPAELQNRIHSLLTGAMHRAAQNEVVRLDAGEDE